MFLDGRKIMLSQSIKTAFRYVKGIGSTRLNVFLRKANLNRKTLLKKIHWKKRLGLSIYITKRYTTGGQLQRLHRSFLKPHLVYGSYKGIRMTQGLPSNGQRTHSNAITAGTMPRIVIVKPKPKIAPPVRTKKNVR